MESAKSNFILLCLAATAALLLGIFTNNWNLMYGPGMAIVLFLGFFHICIFKKWQLAILCPLISFSALLYADIKDLNYNDAMNFLLLRIMLFAVLIGLTANILHVVVSFKDWKRGRPMGYSSFSEYYAEFSVENMRDDMKGVLSRIIL